MVTVRYSLVKFFIFLKNGHLKAEQANHYRTLICQAREHEEEMERSEKVEREEVEEALREKLLFAKYAMQDLLGRCVCVCDQSLYASLVPDFCGLVFHCLHVVAAPIRVLQMGG